MPKLILDFKVTIYDLKSFGENNGTEGNGLCLRFFLFLSTPILVHKKSIRGVAQLASVPAWGAGGRKFESCHPDYLKIRISFWFGFFISI